MISQLVDTMSECRVEQVLDLERAVENGDCGSELMLGRQLVLLTGRLTKWQHVIHGNTLPYRETVTEWLCDEKKWATARRFALCGRGDQVWVKVDDSEAYVRARGCGCRYCPRCSKRGGAKFLRKVSRHLAAGEHGQLWHLVLTQRVIRNEPLEGAKKRFEAVWKRFYPRMVRLGMRSALATYHVKPSSRGGWHYHCHVVMELKVGLDGELVTGKLNEAWIKSLNDTNNNDKAIFARKCADAGPALQGVGEQGQMEFWTESEDSTTRLLQYVVRDVLQGCETWICAIEGRAEVKKFAETLANTKLQRLYGAWRKKVESDVLGESKEKEVDRLVSSGEDGKGKCKEWTVLGTIDQVLWAARSKEERAVCAMKLLGAGARNKGTVAVRLKKLLSWLGGN